MTKRVLVTGAGGFVGRAIVRGMLAGGYEVYAADLHFDDALMRDWVGHSVTLCMGELAQLKGERFDAVVHAAALTASPEELGQSPSANLRANIEPLLALCEQVQIDGRLIFISSSAVFPLRLAGALTEDTPPAPEGTYAVAKLCGEGFVHTLRTVYGQDALAVRLSYIYGAQEAPRGTRPRVSLVAKLLDAALHGEPLPIPTQDLLRDWTYAPDVARAILALLQAPTLAHSLYHIGSGERLSTRQIAEAIRQWLPQTTLQTVDTPPQPARAWLNGLRLRAELGFSAYTPFLEGIGEVIQQAQAERTS